MRTFLLSLLFGVLLYSSSVLGKSFDWQFANTSVWLSAAAYCETSTYKTRTFKGASTGFIVTNIIDYKSEDVQVRCLSSVPSSRLLTSFSLIKGYIGYLPSQSTIYVVFRGSTSIADWANNLDAILTSYPKCSKCEVHKGFYKAEQAVIAEITSAVRSLKAQFPSYTILVTGHSLGAAMATLTSLDFLSSGGLTPLRMFHFGSPRVGNDEFAAYASSVITDRNRNTHYKDMVPHVPMHERFTHISGEWYEDDKGVLRMSRL